MSLKKLSEAVHSVISASSEINTYKKAVEELVFNALDAESTSIAVRIHIQDSTIQVIDNGNGIKKCDFKVLGQKCMTSKVIDLSTLKSVPLTYGYRGESLNNIVVVSQIVKIISRSKENEETWVKTFFKGKQKNITEMPKRPSKGTTVIIKGFLYNLNIQKKTVDSFNELQNIRLFLKHISLVHNDISLSLRNDSKNKIIFKIHKNRNIHQTLSSLFHIEETDVQELQVEKNDYKVRGFIGKTENTSNQYWIFLNGRFINNNSKLHKMVNDNFNKSLKKRTPILKRLKSKKLNIEENHLLKNNIPCYFIFISCPYLDYHSTDTSEQSVLEFREWGKIKKLLEKLIKFYSGDINLKDITKPNKQVIRNQEQNKITEDTRDQVKLIMNKILGSGYKKGLGITQLQNGVKGKLVKRNKKKLKDNRSSKPTINLCKKADDINKDYVEILYQSNKQNYKEGNTEKKKNNINKIARKKINAKNIVTKKLKAKNRKPCSSNGVDEKNRNHNASISFQLPKEVHINNLINTCKKKKIQKKPNQDKLKKYKKHHKKIIVNNTDSVEKRCRIVAEEAEFFLQNNKVKTNRNSLHRYGHNKIENVVNHGHVPLPPKLNKNIIDSSVWIEMKQKSFKTTYDLVQTILKSQQELVYAEKEHYNDSQELIYAEKENSNDNQHINHISKRTSMYSTNANDGSKLTFKSHCYHKNNSSLTSNIGKKYSINNQNFRFITGESRDNFKIPNEKFKSKCKNKRNYKTKPYESNKFYDIHIKQTIEESVYTIEFSTSNSSKDERANRIFKPTFDTLNTYKLHNLAETNYSKEIQPSCLEYIPIGRNTYTSSPLNFPDKYNSQYPPSIQNLARDQYRNSMKLEPNNNFNDTFNISENNNEYSRNSLTHRVENKSCEKNLNVIFISNSQISNTASINARDFEPLEICETILNNNNNENVVGVNFNRNKSNDSLFQNVPNVHKNPLHGSVLLNFTENVSHHFSNIKHSENLHPDVVQNINNIDKVDKTDTQIVAKIIEEKEQNKYFHEVLDPNNELDCSIIINNHFNIKDRLRFLPKGMSQIFAICNSKTTCDYNLDRDYFKDKIYIDFVNDVQVNVKTYEPLIQNVNDFTTTDIQKFNDKLNKGNTTLMFDGQSLKDAKVLGQVDNKFIAAIMREKKYSSRDSKNLEYLVLFDQHAVHERIRLEKNLRDYLNCDQWKSILLDNITLNLPRDEVLYLYNYNDKFTQLGLKWTIFGDCEVSINAIPEAILGKNPREVEKIIKAVRNLIREAISIIKLQKGCLSMYPKSIMDLVFSEACRYAIKFGDILSKTDCKDLLQALSECKTPFQCAHGRPVMAVLLDITSVNREYKVHLSKVKEFVQKRKQ